MQISLEGLSFHSNYIPTNQFWGRPLDMGQMGSGSAIQPFKTVQDYDNWIKRASALAHGVIVQLFISAKAFPQILYYLRHW
jgi:uncharacterized protein (DUF885 family)